MKSLFSDTLFKRLFVLMWLALVASHLLGFWAAHQVAPAGLPPPPAMGELPMPALPPIERLDGPPRRDAPGSPEAGGGPPPFRGLSTSMLWLDYTVRALAIALAAFWGARWLSAPIRRLSRASRQLGEALQHGQPPEPLDERRGTVEVREAAHVFNTMASQLQSQFAAQQLLMAAISHDLRTPLARLRLRLEQIDAGAQGERCVADIHEMDALIDGALALLREHHDATAPERIDLTALLQAMTDDLAEQGHAVTLHAQPAVVVEGQPAALRRLFANLIGNALRHAGSAEVGVTPRGDRVHVTVDDRGPGIPPDRLDKVFQPFYRIEPAAADAPLHPKGAGLGLHIARDLAQRHGGTLALQNRDGGGLRVSLLLPRAADATLSSATQTSETRDTGGAHTGRA